MYTVRYNKKQLLNVAVFIFKNSPAGYNYSSTSDVAESIHNHIHEQSQELVEMLVTNDRENWTDSFSTAGYTLLFTTDDDKTIDVEILVDINVGQYSGSFDWVKEKIEYTTPDQTKFSSRPIRVDEWIGKNVVFNGHSHHVVDVDTNDTLPGFYLLLIDNVLPGEVICVHEDLVEVVD